MIIIRIFSTIFISQVFRFFKYIYKRRTVYKVFTPDIIYNQKKLNIVLI